MNKKVAKFKVNTRQAIARFLLITKPMHKLMNKEIEILVEILVLFTEEQGNFKRVEDAWKIVFSRDNMYNIRTKLNISKAVYNNRLYALRRKGIIKNNQVIPAYNPMIDPNNKSFELIFRFEIDESN